MYGGRGASGFKPWRERTSEKFTPIARTSINTSPGPGVGSGVPLGRSFSGGHGFRKETACIVDSTGGLYPIAKARGRVEDLAPHRGREHAGARVLLARMIGAEEPPAFRQRMVNAVSERGLRLQIREPEPAAGAEEPVESDPPEHETHAHAGERAHFTDQILAATIGFDRFRPIPRWRASERGGDVGAAERHAVVPRNRIGAICEPLPEELAVEPVPRPVAREDASRAVAPVRRRRQADDQEPGLWVSEAGHRQPPVDLVPERGPAHPRHLLAVAPEPGTPVAGDHVRPDLRERIRRRL